MVRYPGETAQDEMRRYSELPPDKPLEGSTTIPESEWKKIQELSTQIKFRMWELEKDVLNLDNLLHALHGEGVRDYEYTSTHRPQVFVAGKWVDR